MKRYIIIDTLKGLAVIGMIFFHLWTMLHYFSLVTTSEQFFPIYIVGRIAAVLFIICAGFNIHFSLRTPSLKKALRRICILSFCALGVTITTKLFIPNVAIYFGILHFFALASVFLLPLYYRNLRFQYYLFGLLCVQILISQAYIHMPYNYLFLPFGYYPVGFASLDYYPLFPWLYVLCLGVVLATMNVRYPVLEFLEERISLFRNKKLAYIGKHSLFIYMVHVPILVVLLFGLLILKQF